MGLIERLQADCHYGPEDESQLDDLIAYKDALEDLVGIVDEAAVENAHGRCSAADVMAVLFHNGFAKEAA